MDQFGQTSSDRTRPTPWAFPFLYSYFSANSAKLTWACTQREDGQRIALRKLRNTQVGSNERVFFKQNLSPTFPTTLVLEGGSGERARLTAGCSPVRAAGSSLAALLYLRSALVQQGLRGSG